MTDQEQYQFIQDNYKTMAVQDMAVKLKRGHKWVMGYMELNGLEPKKRVANTVGHPFRKMNRKLEAIVIERKIENRKYNPR
jgi:hypothetical protein